MRYYLFGLLLFMALGCNTTSDGLVVSEFSPSSSDFSYLIKAVDGKRIVALGQSTNGLGDVMTMKVNMVKYLNEELDYDVLIFDTGFGDAGAVYAKLENTDAKQFHKGSTSGYNLAAQLRPLFTYMKEKSETDDPLFFTGYSPEITAKGFKFDILYLIKKLEPKIIQDSVRSGIDGYYDLPKYVNDEPMWQKTKEKYLAGLKLASGVLADYKEEILEDSLATDAELGHLQRSLKQMEGLVDFPFGTPRQETIGIRDRLMAENVDYIANTLYPDKKIIVWGHNGSIEQDDGNDTNPVKWMGHYLNDKFGDDYYSIGIVVKKGEYYQTWSSKVSPFDLNHEKFVEGKMTFDYGENVFLDLPPYNATSGEWYDMPIIGFEPESGGEVEFIPSQRFDALMLLQESKSLIFSRE